MMASDGRIPQMPCYDDLDYLKYMYTKQQILEMWNAVIPKRVKTTKTIVFYGTAEQLNDLDDALQNMYKNK